MTLHKLATKLTVWLLRKGNLDQEDQMKITTALIDNIGLLPVSAIITHDDNGQLYVSGKKITTEQAVRLRQSAMALKDNYARRIFRDQIAFLAIEMGVHKGLTPDLIMFSKASLWYVQEENKLIEGFTQQ